MNELFTTLFHCIRKECGNAMFGTCAADKQSVWHHLPLLKNTVCVITVVMHKESKQKDNRSSGEGENQQRSLSVKCQLAAASGESDGS